MTKITIATALLIALPVQALAADLSVLPAHIRTDPFGQIVAADRAAAVPPAKQITLVSARGAYASCRIVVSGAQPAAYSVSASGELAAELYREWFHFLPKSKLYYPDALIPAALPHKAQLPDAANHIQGQTAQSYWLDIWIPESATPGVQALTVSLDSGGVKSSVPIRVEVLDAVVPAEDPIVIDHNSYGTSWFAGQYPELAKRTPNFYLSDPFFGLIHAYHRVFMEHRGIYHQLGYGHGGKTAAEFAPRLEGSGKTKRVADWTLYDKHYGPLLDGSAFAGTRRGARPIPYVYLPVNPEWPASFLWWGEPGYEREFVNVMREMEAHFREKGWTKTKYELFFNHKKRYKAFHWDGDETRFLNDLPVFVEYHRLMKTAIPPASPVKWLFRTDASWQMERQFKEQAGIIDFWVVGGGMFNWYAENAPLLKVRGDTVWTYGGTPDVDKPASHITLDMLRPWMLGVDGFVRWQTVIPGPDPWFKFSGGGETLVYPGGRFGIDAPLASVRLKLQRNALQDLALLDSLKSAIPPASLRAEAAKRYNGTTPADWRSARPKLADSDPLTWDNVTIGDALPPDPRFESGVDAAAWDRVRGYVISLVKERRP
ncbi:MAG: DUF4091 domain-containing protein [Bryobacteraceae bacterium]|nr:DUF4091 domain-containing protein [Bryobacteraceae bacterium]